MPVERTSLPLAGHSPSWTPDGKIIFAVGTGGASSVWIMDSGGGNAHQVGATLPRNVNRPMQAKNGTIVFDQLSISGGDDAMMMNADGSNQHVLVAGGAQPFISRDGSWVAYMVQTTSPQHREVWRINADGTGAAQLTFPTDPVYPDANAPAISPDGQWIAFFSGVEADLSPDPWGNIAVIPAAGGPRVHITGCVRITGPGPDPAGSCRAADNPFWYYAPDGELMVGYDRGSANPEAGGTWVQPFAGGTARRIWPDSRGGGTVPVRIV